MYFCLEDEEISTVYSFSTRTSRFEETVDTDLTLSNAASAQVYTFPLVQQVLDTPKCCTMDVFKFYGGMVRNSVVRIFRIYTVQLAN